MGKNVQNRRYHFSMQKCTKTRECIDDVFFRATKIATFTTATTTTTIADSTLSLSFFSSNHQTCPFRS